MIVDDYCQKLSEKYNGNNFLRTVKQRELMKGHELVRSYMMATANE